MTWSPVGKSDRVKLAADAFAPVAERGKGPVSGVDPSKNCSVPIGAPTPPGADTVPVTVVSSPTLVGPGDVVIDVCVGATKVLVNPQTTFAPPATVTVNGPAPFAV